ncbi:PREDICTED: uncharacterized protein LOC104820509 [Tarenaya hassleriana]|uniref:uncharacterized protein LOC104820509 n=1 Tax=Tarenaya hassleriana TaxID=28532 RepID=UPI00053C25D6|nr:PREDICTED: uncharacterized protein LOC104820509 [Tarenaya hassleriana]
MVKKMILKAHVGFRHCCFFCVLEETDPFVRKAGIEKTLREMHTKGDTELALTLSFIWRFAMAEPENPEFPSLGIFECMARLIKKGVEDAAWLARGQNVYVPYYAAHIIGSYTMKKSQFAVKAVESGVIPPLIELMRGKMSWVEQRVAVRALGHLASYSKTFETVSEYEEEVVRLAMEIASNCIDVVYNEFVGVKDRDQSVKYHCDLLTRGLGGVEMENRRAEEWASQLQCWSLHLLNCFACKERSINVICNKIFLKNLSKMWGGLVNHTSPAGVGLIRILCYSKRGRGHVSESREVVLSLCNLSRSSDDWQYMGIDCLLLLLKDQDTRYKVIDIAVFYLRDLIELQALNDRPDLGDRITRVFLMNHNTKRVCAYNNQKTEKALKEIRNTKVERTKKEREFMSEEKVAEKRVLVRLIQQQADKLFSMGDMEGAITCYNKAINACPLKLRRKRMSLYSGRGEMQHQIPVDDLQLSTCTRSLSEPANAHGKSLWTRSKAYDMKGLARESLMDCIMFVNGRCCSKNTHSNNSNGSKIPFYAAEMISKQMNATRLFADSKSRALQVKLEEVRQISDKDSNSDSDSNSDQEWYKEMVTRMITEKKKHLTGLSTINEEPWNPNEGITSRMMMHKKKPALLARSM